MDRPPSLTLLPWGLARLYLVPSRPSTGCGICGRPHARALTLRCDRCGLEFDDACYWPRVASVREAVAFEVATDAELERFLFLCGGCRS